MPTSALALALGAACIHALWNLLLARARDIEAATAVAVVVAEVVFLPLAVVLWHAHRAVVPFIIVSAALQLLYFALLPTAYRLPGLSVVVPIAPGAAAGPVPLVRRVGLGAAASPGPAAGVSPRPPRAARPEGNSRPGPHCRSSLSGGRDRAPLPDVGKAPIDTNPAPWVNPRSTTGRTTHDRTVPRRARSCAVRLQAGAQAQSRRL